MFYIKTDYTADKTLSSEEFKQTMRTILGTHLKVDSPYRIFAII